jgi:putative MATE family efflux protein
MSHRPHIDREFYSRMIRIAAPIIMQQAVTSCLGLVDTMLVGQLGDASVAGVALANQVYLIMSLVVFGLSSGASIFIAQFWGNHDIKNIRKVLGLNLLLAAAIGLCFSVVSFFFPEFVLGIFSRDSQVIRIGAGYLRIVCVYYPFYAIAMIYSGALRSTRHVKLPMAVSATALTINTSLGYILIFGKLGFPALGVTGAAFAMVIARMVEFSAMVGFTYLFHAPAAASFAEMAAFDLPFARSVLKTSLPVVLNEAIWSLGNSMYNLVYARMSTEAIAATNIASTIEGLMYIPFLAIAYTCAIMTGNLIGAGESEKAFSYTKKFFRIAIGGAVLMGVIMFFCIDPILQVYQITDTARYYTHQVMLVLVALFWVKSSNYMMFTGVLRAGGDTRFALIFELISMWLYGVPLAFLLAFVFRLPVYWVVVGVVSEEALKFIIAWWRYFSKKWIHHLASPAPSPLE